MSLTEKLGATCTVTTTQSQRSAHCEVPACGASGVSQGCAGATADTQAVTIAGQPVLRISLDSLDAGGDSDQALPLGRISFLYRGDTEALAAWLETQYGPALNPTPDAGVTSYQLA